jgi:hypothetical protein
MDLLRLPEDIFNEVVLYLNAKDIRKASLVCKGWYRMFGESKKCMEKLTVCYKHDNYNNDLDPLLKSSRKYQNLIIRFYNRSIKESGIEKNIREILKKFSKSLVKLETSHDFKRICELPKLKELEYRNFRRHTYTRYSNKNYLFSNGLIATCLNVTNLNISFDGVDDKYSSIFIEALKKMHNLKSLTLDRMNFLKNIQPADIKFRLDTINTKSYTRLREIKEFMNLHRSTIKLIKANSVDTEDMKYILCEFPKLRSLYIDYFHHDEIKDGPSNFSQNFTVQNLFITAFSNYPLMRNGLAPLFCKLKNLKRVRVYTFYSEFIPELLACTSLKLVEYQRFDNDVTEDQRNYINAYDGIKFIRISNNF